MQTNDATVLVVDDDAQARRGVARLIRSAGYGVRLFSSPKRFLREPLPLGPTCVLLDMCMDGMSGLDVQDVLRQNARHTPIVFLSGHGTVPTAAAGFKHGAEDFLEKPPRPDKLLEAIQRAIETDKRMSKDRGEVDELNRRYATLTARERDVMDLVVSGLLNKQSAAELGISEKTIKVHRARVMEKMQVESLAALVQMAGRMRLPAAALPVTMQEPVPSWQMKRC